MLKKITALLLLTAFTNVYAITPIQQSNALANELNKSFDSLNYKLNVEWNQKDSKFFDATIADFEKEIAGLQKEGVTSKDLIKYTTDKIKDKQIQNDIQEMTKVIAESQMSNEEARAFVVSKLSSTYSHGASWSGSRIGVHAAIIVGIIVLILVCVHRHNNDTTTEQTPPSDTCQTPTYECQYDWQWSSTSCCYTSVVY
ncbi:MAG: hypothetical protein H7281_00745 [Bacteriovorax sp.]|nr:hypothetical protein [Bacteriovorax sp.]